jgi:hypothetical protein
VTVRAAAAVIGESDWLPLFMEKRGVYIECRMIDAGIIKPRGEEK